MGYCFTLKSAVNRPEKQTLCWYCRHAVPSIGKGTGCSWSQKGRPVDGWTAQRRDVLLQRPYGLNELVESYRVENCPRFESG